jgi:hypothetical protein
MNNLMVERMRARAQAVRTRAAIRHWEFRQRHLAAGVWYRLRRMLARAETAYEISATDARQLVAEGYRVEPSGRGINPEKTILFVEASRLSRIESRRPVRVGLGADFLSAPFVALVPFDADGATQSPCDAITGR